MVIFFENFFLGLSRFQKKIFLAFIDSFLLVFALYLSFSLRLGYWLQPEKNLLLLILISPVVGVLVFWSMRMYRLVTRYLNLDYLWLVLKSAVFFSSIWGLLAFTILENGIPRSVLIINTLVSFSFIGGIRLAYWRILKNTIFFKLPKISRNYKNVIIYGAGDAGIQLASALEYSQLYKVILFLDDSNELHGHKIRGLKVYSSESCGELIKKYSIDEILLAIPSVSKARKKEIIEKIKENNISVKTLPGVDILAKGDITLNDLREIDIKDLLGRDPVEPKNELLKKNITDKNVLVTGGGGSIGSELCRQIALLKPKALVIFELSEFALYSIDKELRENSIEIDIYPILGNILDQEKVFEVINSFEIHTIYHAAAYKHVPMVELNNIAGINTNILGTLNLIEQAKKSRVENFVFISSDKAVRPTNLMGASKRFAELIIRSHSEELKNQTIFSIVRFGNVLGSSGSVIPLFKKQIANGGPLTLTSPEITRYFMTISEAVQLVIQAGAMSKHMDVYLLDMGSPIKILDLARTLISLSGLQVKDKDNQEGDIEIIYTGLRPGEKLYEELLIDGKAKKTIHPLIYISQEKNLDWSFLNNNLSKLKNLKSNDVKAARKIIQEIVPEYNAEESFHDLIFQRKHKKNL